MKPIIAIAPNLDTWDERHKVAINTYYTKFIEWGGGVPFIVPAFYNPLGEEEGARKSVEQLMSLACGLLLPGGADVHPFLYGEDAEPSVKNLDPDLDAAQMLCIDAALGKMPILGICRGEQLLNVHQGGSLVQHLPAQKDVLEHTQNSEPWVAHQTLQVVKNSFLGKIFGESVCVNTFHHQAVNEPAPNFKVTALAADGVVEAIEGKANGHLLLGVQWHPEGMADKHPTMRALAKAFVAECSKAQKKKKK